MLTMSTLFAASRPLLKRQTGIKGLNRVVAETDGVRAQVLPNVRSDFSHCFNRVTAFSCSGLPMLATCTFVPSNVSPILDGRKAVLFVDVVQVYVEFSVDAVPSVV